MIGLLWWCDNIIITNWKRHMIRTEMEQLQGRIFSKIWLPSCAQKLCILQKTSKKQLWLQTKKCSNYLEQKWPKIDKNQQACEPSVWPYSKFNCSAVVRIPQKICACKKDLHNIFSLSYFFILVIFVACYIKGCILRTSKLHYYVKTNYAGRIEYSS